MVCRWTVRAAERLKTPGAQDRARQLEGRFQHDPHVARWLDAFLDDWLGTPHRPRVRRLSPAFALHAR